MLKFLRKYNKWILVVGGSLLMVTWLVGPTTQKLTGDPAKRTIARIGTQKITYADEMQANLELMALNEWAAPVVQSMLRLNPRDGLHWLLLNREADAAGYTAYADDGEAWVPDAARLIATLYLDRDPMLRYQLQMEAKGADDWQDRFVKAIERQTAYAAGKNKMTMPAFYEALAKLRGVMRMETAYMQSPRASDRREEEFGRRMFDGAVIDYLAIPADLWTPSEPDPTEEALSEHFEKYRSVRPGVGEFGLGYLQPDRVQIEWLTLDRKILADALAIDLVEANKRYRQQRDKYKGEFAAEKDAVIRDMKEELVEKVLQASQVAVQVEVQKAVRGVDVEGRYKKLPADWESRRPRMETVAQAVVDHVKETLGLTIPLPSVTIKASGWLTRAELEAQPGIGEGAARQGGFNTPFADVVMMARELDGKGQFAIQAGFPMAEAYVEDGGGHGNRYYFSILAARKESPPDSVAEIRDQVVNDLKKVRVFETLKGRVEEFRAKAIEGGLEAVLEGLPKAPEVAADKPEGDKKPPAGPKIARGTMVNRERVGRPREGGDPTVNIDVPEVRTGVMDAAQKIDPTKPLDTIDRSVSTLAVAAPTRLAVVVARVVASRPMTVEALRRQEPQIEREIAAQSIRPGPGIEDPFSLPALKQRLKYVQVVTGRKGDDGDTGTGGGG